MIQIPFLVGAAIGAGVTLYMKRKNKGQDFVGTVSDGVKTSASTVKNAANSAVITVKGAATTTVDTVKSTVEVIKEKNAEKKAARTPAKKVVTKKTPTKKAIAKKTPTKKAIVKKDTTDTIVKVNKDDK